MTLKSQQFDSLTSTTRAEHLEFLLRGVLEVQELVTLVGLDGHVLEVNATLCDSPGYAEAELLANGVHSVTHPDDRKRGRDLIDRALRGGGDRYRFEK